MWSMILSPSKIRKALELLDAMIDPDPCDWDHNHSCQAHGFYYIPQGTDCPNNEAKELLASLRKEPTSD